MLAPGSTIAVLGGTGDLGSGLATRWARAGYQIIIGSRDAARAQATAAAINQRNTSSNARGASYEEAAAAGAVAVLAIPFASQSDILSQVRLALSGKVLIDCTAPLRPPKVGTVQLPPAGSAAQTSQALLGEGVTVVSAFQNVGAKLLHDDHDIIECDVLVCSDRPEARKLGVQLANAAGLRGIEAGPLANSAAAEALTSVLITINRLYKADHAGVRVTGLPEAASS